MNITPYVETKIAKYKDKKILVLIIANASSCLANLDEKICVMIKVIAIKIANTSIKNNPIADVIIKNQKEKPVVTIIDFIRDDENCNYIG